MTTNWYDCFPPKKVPQKFKLLPEQYITDSSQDDYTDERPCNIVWNRSSTIHITEDSPSNTSQIRTRSTTKQLNHCLENQKGGHYLLRYTKIGKRSCRIITDSSQDD